MTPFRNYLTLFIFSFISMQAFAGEVRVAIPGWPEDTVVTPNHVAVTLHSTQPKKMLSIVNLDHAGSANGADVHLLEFPEGLSPQSLTTNNDSVYVSVQYPGKSDTGSADGAEFADLNKPIILKYTVDELIGASDRDETVLPFSSDYVVLTQSESFSGHAAQGLVFHDDTLYLSMCSLVLTPTGRRQFCYGPGTIITVDPDSGDARETPSPTENPVGFFPVDQESLLFFSVPEGRNTVARKVTTESGIEFADSQQVEFTGYYTTVAFDSQRREVFLAPGGFSRGTPMIQHMTLENLDTRLTPLEFGSKGSFALAARYWQEMDGLLIGDGSQGELLFFQRQPDGALNLSSTLKTRYSMIHTISDLSRGLMIVVSGNAAEGELAVVMMSSGDSQKLVYANR